MTPLPTDATVSMQRVRARSHGLFFSNLGNASEQQRLKHTAYPTACAVHGRHRQKPKVTSWEGPFPVPRRHRIPCVGHWQIRIDGRRSWWKGPTLQPTLKTRRKACGRVPCPSAQSHTTSKHGRSLPHGLRLPSCALTPKQQPRILRRRGPLQRVWISSSSARPPGARRAPSSRNPCSAARAERQPRAPHPLARPPSREAPADLLRQGQRR